MCGIVGVVASADDVRMDLNAALLALTARGPDDQAVSIGPGHTLGYRRLAIRHIDDGSDSGRQPYRSIDGMVTLFGVGEVYNDGQVRSQSSCGTAPEEGDLGALLCAFLHGGVCGLANIQGEFSCAIWDGRSRTLILARDPFGIKPLFYKRTDDGLAFATEVTALRALGIPLRADQESIAAYLRFNYPLPPRTFYQDVWSVPPGTAVLWRDGNVWTEPFLTLEAIALGAGRQQAPDPAEVQDALRIAVQSRLISDVPLGMHLSGGLDSSLICELAEQPQLNAYTIEYGDGSADSGFGDMWWAGQVARRLNLRHRPIVVRPDEGAAAIDEVIRVLGSPLMSPGAITPYLLAREAHRDGIRVLLEGQGSDEIFLGYDRYRYMVGEGAPAAAEVAANVDLADLRAVAPSWRDRFTLADTRFQALGDDSAGHQGLVRFQLAYQRSFMHELLRIEDHVHMANAVENRPPFLDHTMAEAGFRLAIKLGAGALGKPVLREILSRRGLVAAGRPHKQQMPLPPPTVTRWSQNVLLGGDALERLTFIDQDAARRLIVLTTSVQPTVRRQRLLWALANLARWSERESVPLEA
jgi:asparagine synthase (glutamine-hydrolysing)